MFYVFSNTITTLITEAAPTIQKLDLIAGIIHQVDVLFEDGCDYEAKVQIFHGSNQLWPSNTGETLVGEAQVISFREFYELKPGNTDLTLKLWGDETIDDVKVVVQIGLLPRRVLQPLSFTELLAAATGVK